MIQVSAQIKDLKLEGKSSVTWGSLKNLFAVSHCFEIEHFTAKVDDYNVQGGFTQLVFQEGDFVDVIIKRDDKNTCYEVLALLTDQDILHIAPYLHPLFPRVNENQNIPKLIYYISSIVMIVMWLYCWSWSGLLIGVLFGFITLFLLSIGIVIHQSISERIRIYHLRKALFKTQLFSGIKQKDIDRHQHWYRMKEYVVDLKTIKARI